MRTPTAAQAPAFGCRLTYHPRTTDCEFVLSSHEIKMPILSVNPASNEQLESFVPLIREEMLAAIETASDAFDEWRHTSISKRRAVLLKVATQLRSRLSDYASMITTEMGKRISESEYEVEYCAKIAEYYANNAERFLADQPVQVEDADAFIQYEPIGVLLGVMPWNFPFYQVIRFAAPNIMCGNTVLLKHASNVPQCAVAIAELFSDSGLPDGVFTNLLIPTEFVETIIEDNRVRGVSLTGSEKAGAAVAALAGKHLKRSVLELGGNDAFIVLDDADMDNVVEMAVKGRMTNAGQSCVASKRFIVVEAVAEQFLTDFKIAMSSLKVGDPLDPETDVAPLSTEQAAVNLAEQVQEAINAGATVLLGGDRPDRAGAFYNPTILAGIAAESPIYDRELFGPVATVYVVKDEQAAVELANDSSYGLGGSVYSKDIDRARRLAQQIDTGMVFINQPTKSQAELPFGGTKNSGYGRELSHLGILEFVNKKLIHVGKK